MRAGCLSRVVVQQVLTCLLSATMLSGCRSAFVQAVVRNDTDEPIRLIEVDYPSASFGRETLAPHAEFQYRFKVLGSGPTRVLWTDANRQEHSTNGPAMHEGQQGSLEIVLGASAANWRPDLH